MQKKIVRITTVPKAFGLLEGQLKFMSDYYEMIGVSSSGTTTALNQSSTEEVPSNHGLNQIKIKEGVRVIPVGLTRKITPVKDLIAVWQLYKILKKEKPFIVHSHTPKAGTVGMIAAYLAGVPHRLHTIAGMPLLIATGAKRRLLDAVEKVTYKCATKIYPNSFGLEEIIKEVGYTTEAKLKVIGKGSSNGIDTSHFDPSLFGNEDNESLRKSLGINPDDFVYVFVGRLVRDKGVNELIQVFDNLNKNKKNTKLLLVGPYEKDLDPLLPETEKIINTHPDIILAGWQNDVRPYFSISDVLTFPSYREGFPNVVMQSGAMGLPSIVTDINGCNEIVINNQNGIIVPPRETEMLFKAMVHFYTINKEDKLFNADNNRKMITDRYERRAIWEALLEEYKSLE